MKKQFIFIVLFVSSLTGYAQQTIPQELVYQDSVPYFYAWNDSIIQTRQDKFKQTTYISINGRTADTLNTRYGGFGRNISSNDAKRKDVIYSGSDYYRISV
ncbi:MAG: hypothetical protein LBU51_03235, partial [Bacteroidales bacterium]|nr:hypothetical protein [Bacteroidales bacterium]